MSRFIFLDRDGTLIQDKGYTHKFEDYELFPEVVSGLSRLARADFRLVIVTNQSGIGRGYFTQEEYEIFQAEMVVDLAHREVQIEKTYFCPHSPEDRCRCRKPKPGLLLQAQKELQADLSQSWVIGDKESDLELASNAGCAGAILILTGEGEQTSQNVPETVLRARSMNEAADIILASLSDN